MSIPNKDEVEGKWEQVKGTVKDKVGEANRRPRIGSRRRSSKCEGEDTGNLGKIQTRSRRYG